MSQVYPAFWLRPGDNETQPGPNPQCTAGSPAVNTDLVYRYNLAKAVTIGCGLPDDNCLTFISEITIGGKWPSHDYLQFEAPTGYLSLNFTLIYGVDVKSRSVVPHNSTLPVVMATPDKKYAMGAYAPGGQKIDYPLQYGAGSFSLHNFADTTNKWNVVFKVNSIASRTPYTLKYTVYICVGDLNMVADCISNVAKMRPYV